MIKFPEISKERKLSLLKLDNDDQYFKHLVDEDIINTLYKHNFKNKISILNDEQIKAVLYKEGPLFVCSGPGAGKTRVIVNKLYALCYYYNINPSKILAVTFTRKAADEMKERLKHLLPQEDTQRMIVGTFHSVCITLLKKYGQIEFGILDASGTFSTLRTILREKNSDLNIYDVKNIITRSKNNKKGPDSVDDKQISAVFKDYQKFLKDNGLYDFDDIILNTVLLLEKNKEFKKEVSQAFDYILVDEYQDTNGLQYDILKHISESHKNITIVGDTDQSIYGFRFASAENVNKFKKDFPDTKVIMLEQNYRSTKNILSCSHSVISDSRENRIDKKLWTENEEGEKVILYKAGNPEYEAEYIANEIIKLSKKDKYKSMAILFRNNAQSRAVEETLRNHDIPHKMKEEYSFYDRIEIRDMLAYLHLVNAKETDELDIVVFERCLTVPKRGIGEKKFDLIKEYLLDKKLTFSKFVKKLDSVDDLTTLVKDEIKGLYKWISTFKEFKGTLDDLLTHIMDKIKYRKHLEKTEKATFASKWANISELINVLSKYKEDDLQKSLKNFLNDVFTEDNEENEALNRDVVVLSTIHSAKGLEWDTVFIVGVENGIIPNGRVIRSKDNKEMDEERRGLYVAMTRAKKRLYISFVGERLEYGKQKKSKKSFFLNNLPSKSVLEITGEAAPDKLKKDKYKFQPRKKDMVLVNEDICLFDD